MNGAEKIKRLETRIAELEKHITILVDHGNKVTAKANLNSCAIIKLQEALLSTMKAVTGNNHD